VLAFPCQSFFAVIWDFIKIDRVFGCNSTFTAMFAQDAFGWKRISVAILLFPSNIFYIASHVSTLHHFHAPAPHMASYQDTDMDGYNDKGLHLDLGHLGCLRVCALEYANRTTTEGPYVQTAHVFDGEMLLKVVVPPDKWIGVHIYHTTGSYSYMKGGAFPYQWVLVDTHGVECQSDAQSRGTGLWQIYKEWNSPSPDRICLDTAHPTGQWELRDTRTNCTFFVVRCVLAL
jgi:hypothetical protein